MRSIDLAAGPGPVALLNAAALDLDLLGDDALLDAVAEVECSLSWAAALRARMIAAYAARSVTDPTCEEQAWEMDWHRERLAAVCQTSPHEAQVRCDTALALETRLPAARAALESGALPWAQAVALARESADLIPPESSVVERQVLADPRAVSVRQVIQATRRAVAELRPALADRVAAEAHERRSLRFWGAQDGSRVMPADLPVDAAALVAAALEPLAGRTGADDRRTAEQRRADALIQLATGDRPPAVRLAVVMRGRQSGTVGGGALGGDELAPATLRRLTCDAGVDEHPVGPAGDVQPATSGWPARRLPGAGMRRRIELRDGHCRFPGCPTAAARCHAHHLRHWADGGPSTDHNLIMICARHHHAVHEGGWSTRGTAIDLTWVDQHGHTYTRPPDAAVTVPWPIDPPFLDAQLDDDHPMDPEPPPDLDVDDDPPPF